MLFTVLIRFIAGLLIVSPVLALRGHAVTLQAGVSKQAAPPATVQYVYACSLSPVGTETPCIKGYPKWVLDHGGQIRGRHVFKTK